MKYAIKKCDINDKLDLYEKHSQLRIEKQLLTRNINVINKKQKVIKGTKEIWKTEKQEADGYRTDLFENRDNSLLKKEALLTQKKNTLKKKRKSIGNIPGLDNTKPIKHSLATSLMRMNSSALRNRKVNGTGGKIMYKLTVRIYSHSTGELRKLYKDTKALLEDFPYRTKLKVDDERVKVKIKCAPAEVLTRFSDEMSKLLKRINITEHEIECKEA